MIHDRPAHFVEVFRAAALQAAAVARGLQGEVPRRSKPSEDATPEAEALSAADLACQEVILLRLAEVFPEVGLDAEEDTPVVERFAAPSPERPLVVLDPIDGSRNYLNGSPDYAVMAAWIEDGRFQAAVVHFPVYRTSYWASAGQGCRCQRDFSRSRPVSLGDLPRRLLVPPRTSRAVRRRLTRLGDEVVTSRCSAVDATAPVTGRARAAVNPVGPDRRRAIGFLLTLEAGGVVEFRDGPWRREDPAAGTRPLGAHVIAGSPDHAATLLELAADPAS